MSRVFYACLMLVMCASLCLAEGEAKAKTHHKNLTLKEATSIKSITAEPQTFVGKEVLVSGKVTSVCKGSGCWVEVENADGEKIICKSLDESVTVPKDCEGKFIQVQGKVKEDKKASGKAEMKKEPGMAEHACPAPKLLVSMESYAFIDAPAAPATTGAAPAVAPATTVAPEKPATMDKKEVAPATPEKKDVAPATPEKKDAPVNVEKKPAPAPDKPAVPEKPATPEKKDTPPTPPTPTK